MSLFLQLFVLSWCHSHLLGWQENSVLGEPSLSLRDTWNKMSVGKQHGWMSTLNIDQVIPVPSVAIKEHKDPCPLKAVCCICRKVLLKGEVLKYYPKLWRMSSAVTYTHMCVCAQIKLTLLFTSELWDQEKHFIWVVQKLTGCMLVVGQLDSVCLIPSICTLLLTWFLLNSLLRIWCLSSDTLRCFSFTHPSTHAFVSCIILLSYWVR